MVLVSILLVTSVPIAVSGQQSSGVETFINCGGEAITDTWGRTWTADSQVPADGNVLETTAQDVLPPSQPRALPMADPMPYRTARFFRSNVSYTFPSPAGTNFFLRLHFTTAYMGPEAAAFAPKNCSFNVYVNDTLVLAGYSPLAKAQSIPEKPNPINQVVIEELILTSQDGTIAVSLSPISEAHYGFICGIEAVSTAGLYDKSLPPAYSGHTVRRINCGSTNDEVPPIRAGDRTMRWWSIDSECQTGVPLSTSAIGVTGDRDPFYVPVDVLRTWRYNDKDGVSYIFLALEKSRSYLVRLYFFEALGETRRREMNITVRGFGPAASAGDEATVTNYDVVRDGGRLAPAVVDLIFFLNSTTDLQIILWISEWTEIPEATVSGIEIIKLGRNGELTLADSGRVPESIIAGTFPTVDAGPVLLSFAEYPGNSELLSDWVKSNAEGFTNPCYPRAWSMIECTYGAVTAIDLSTARGVAGPIPARLGDLSALRELILSNQKFTGPIPDSLADLVHLEKLKLDGNIGLNGSVPASFGRLSKLEEFDVSGTVVGGPVPTALLDSPSLSVVAGESDLCAAGDATQKRLLKQCPEESEPPFRGRIVAAILGAVAGACVLVGAGVFVYFRKCRDDSFFGMMSSSDSGDAAKSMGPQTMKLGRPFTFAEIVKATNNFDHRRVLGSGGFGSVYEGHLPDGTVVAIKRGSAESRQGIREFQTEIRTLSNLRHRHLVSLVGYCEENGEMILVYEYMANGSLRDHLYADDEEWSLTKSSRQFVLDWRQRLMICVGAAKGLDYLHSGAQEMIIHRDVKSTNILLDDEWVAKVADFGLSKLGPSMNETHVSTVVKGSFGYLDPAYFKSQQLTEKSDVYSFGVVLLEVITARPPISQGAPGEQVSLVDWAKPSLLAGRVEEIVDQRLTNSYDVQSLRKVAEVALRCLNENREARPSMASVLPGLEDALILQETSGSVILDLPPRPPGSAHRSNLHPGQRVGLHDDNTPSSTNSADFHPYGASHHSHPLSSVSINHSHLHSVVSENPDYHNMDDDSMSGASDPPSMASPLTALHSVPSAELDMKCKRINLRPQAFSCYKDGYASSSILVRTWVCISTVVVAPAETDMNASSGSDLALHLMVLVATSSSRENEKRAKQGQLRAC
ncbi:hypothetical protein CBR_g4001 [Chara braunii]|uniref:Protein kinase domain-containing protein n=1 Tax=Chara braunii TaxID=69332 RepID=A0A388KGY3_CHABU|nr:hypothetical protein CBR_g4001 [Chara braunii]|eukprot:GBG69302.1 hypothetical protein CBR_g4001 [Chara braunii]